MTVLRNVAEDESAANLYSGGMDLRVWVRLYRRRCCTVAC